jgi:hypothetical protein
LEAGCPIKTNDADSSSTVMLGNTAPDRSAGHPEFDSCIGEVLRIDVAPELVVNRSPFNLGDDERGMIHVGHGSYRIPPLPTLLSDKNVSTAVNDEFQVGAA